jgi:hypothetical protein
MGTLAVCLVGIAWVFVFVMAIGVNHWIMEMRWRRQAQNRAFDSMVEEYQRQQDARRMR